MCSIYKLYVEGRDEVYVGSTIQTLPRRLRAHKNDLQSGNTSSCSLFALGDVKIQLLESCTVENRTLRERYWVENTPHVVNRYIPGRTKQEYYTENRDRIRAYQNEKVQCPICSKLHTRGQMKRHIRTQHPTPVDAEPTCS